MQQRPELPIVSSTWHASKYKVHKLHQRYILQWDFLVSLQYSAIIEPAFQGLPLWLVVQLLCQRVNFFTCSFHYLFNHHSCREKCFQLI